jgi:hypothetical protein
MANYTNSLTGHGTDAFGGGHSIVDIYLELRTAGDLVRFNGFAPMRRVHQAGWVGFGFAPDTTYPDFLTWQHFLEVEAFDWSNLAGDSVVHADTIYWDVTPGTTIYVELIW